MEKVFEVKIDLSQNIDEFPNIHKIRSNDYLDLTHILNNESYRFEENEIIVRGNFQQLDEYDFISNDLNIPIFSKKFINAIDKSKENGLKIIPIKIYDDTGQIQEPRNDFFTIDFRIQYDFLDLDKSIFRKLRSEPNKKGILKKVVFKKELVDIPVIFRIKESISKLFVSESLLKHSNFNGFRMERIISYPKKADTEFERFIELNPNFNLAQKNNVSFINININVKLEDIELLLEKLWYEKFEITFHDTIYPTLTDPGAYFSYSTKGSENNSFWSMTYGNHGWSGGIYNIKKRTVAKQISNLIQTKSINKIQITNVTFFSSYEIKDEESSIKKDFEIFEMHSKN